VKISNETKIGALTAIAVTFLILGFNFLKGKTLFKTGTFLYANFDDTRKLSPSNPVYINGYQIGSVYEIRAGNSSLSKITVTIKLNALYNIPDNSVAEIETALVGSPNILITPGNSTRYLQSEDTIKTRSTPGLLGDVSERLAPVADQLQATLGSLDTVLRNFNSVLDPATKGNLQGVIANLHKATASIIVSANAMQRMLNEENGSLAKALNNVDSFTANLVANNQKISNTMTNIERTTDNLSKADIDGAVNSLKSSVDELDEVMNKINSTNGSLGAMINDKELYNNINNTIRSLNTLMDDLRVHPKRYVNISVFGKKDKGNYLTEPLKKDSTSGKQ
jgi:phospholipid/cholesterol/gamma-HCH transport system substrate-binding protein